MKKLLLSILSIIMLYGCNSDSVESSGYNSNLRLSESDIIVGSQSGVYTVDVYVSDKAYLWEISGSSSWCKPTRDYGYGPGYYIFFEFTENPDMEDRNAVFEFKAGLNTATLTITQKGHAAEYEISKDGGIIEVKMLKNVDYRIEIEADWVKEISKDSTAANIKYFEISKNILAESRNTQIKIISNRNEDVYIVYVTQQASSYIDINVLQKGTLSEVLAKNNLNVDDIVLLRISGVLNDVDFLFIYRMMPKLRNLDIADVEITSLPNQAFYNSTNVEYLILPNTLTVIGDEMFYNSKLKVVSIPKTVETIGADAFYNTSLTSIEIPANVTKIGERAFFGCPITSIKIPASVTTIGAGAFQDCSNLATVTFEDGSQLKTIGGGYYKTKYYGAFSGCPITSIKIPASVETIGDAAFKGCKLKTVTFEKGSQLKTIDGGYSDEYDADYHFFRYYYHGAFSDCPITSIEIPASVETIGPTAFEGCSKLATVTFEERSQLKTIRGTSYTFYSSPNYYISYRHGAFYELYNLMTVDMSECTQVKSIEKYAFYGDKELRLFMIGTEVPPTCGDYAFYGINQYSVLKVPSGCAGAYKTADGWKNFANISGFDE